MELPYRLIEIPAALFGVIGSLVALLGFVVPGLARRLGEQHWVQPHGHGGTDSGGVNRALLCLALAWSGAGDAAVQLHVPDQFFSQHLTIRPPVHDSGARF